MIRLIAAIDDKFGIAKGGDLPWALPKEQQHFKEMTLQHGGVLVMGRKTYAVIGRQLPGRQNYVLSKTTPDARGGMVVHDLNAFLKTYPDVWVIGGESIYKQTLEQADELYITRIEGDFNCDQFFPAFSPTIFTLQQRSPAQHENGFTYYYEVYTKLS